MLTIGLLHSQSASTWLDFSASTPIGKHPLTEKRDLYKIIAVRRIRHYFDRHASKTIATSIVHSKLDYCNSLYYGLPKYQINRL